ncbi:hypothetical protein MRY87_11170 [bacterium]|nr:hypothetical protein [bacterium]
MLELGKFLILLGVGSFALHFFEYEFRLLMWIDTWGEVMGNIIRVSIAILGAVLCYIGSSSREEAEESFDDIEVKSESAEL